MSDETLNHEVAKWLAGLAKIVEEYGDGETGHGAYYVSAVTVGYDGDDTGYRVLPNEFGGYDIALTHPTPIPTPHDPTRAGGDETTGGGL